MISAAYHPDDRRLRRRRSVKTIETKGAANLPAASVHPLVLVHDREHGPRARGRPRPRFGGRTWRCQACRSHYSVMTKARRCSSPVRRS